MFQQPKPGISYVAPAQPIDIEQRYLVKVEELTDLGPSKFPQPGDDPDNPTHRIQWTFLMADTNGNRILDVDGNPYKHRDYTSSKTGKAQRAGGKTATARMWMEALYGKPLEDEEIGPDIANELRGKSAVALFEEKEKQSQAGETYTALTILRLSPRKAGAAQEATAETRAAAEKAQATVARARKPEQPEAEGELPF